MEPTINQPLPTQPTPIVPQPSNTKWIILGAIIIILIIGGGIFAYTKFMSDQNTQGQSDRASVSLSEQKAVSLAFDEIAQIVKKHDLGALADYLLAVGGTPKDFNFTDNSADNEVAFDLMYKNSFEPLLEDSASTDKMEIFNKKTVFQKGKYVEDGEEYIEMVVTGVNSLDEKEASNVSIIHTFVQINHKWYWVSFDFKISGTISPDEQPKIDKEAAKQQMIEEVVKVQAMVNSEDIPGLFSYMRLTVPENEQAAFDAHISKANQEEKDRLLKSFRFTVHSIDVKLLTTGSTTWIINSDTAYITVEATPEDGVKIRSDISFVKKNNQWVIDMS